MTSETILRVFADRAVLSATALWLASLGATGWALSGNRSGAKSQPPVFTHLHCPACGREYAYRAALLGKNCVVCGTDAAYVPTVGSIQTGGSAKGSWNSPLAFVLLNTVLLQGLVYLVVVRLRALRDAHEAARAQLRVCHCPFCERKIGYRLAQAETGFVCSRCKTAFFLPTVTYAESEARD